MMLVLEKRGLENVHFLMIAGFSLKSFSVFLLLIAIVVLHLIMSSLVFTNIQ